MWLGPKQKRITRALGLYLTSGTLLALLMSLLAWMAMPVSAQETEIPVPLAPPSALAGAPLYAQNCAPCHGDTGAGDGPTASSLPTPPTQFADAATMWTLAPSELFSVTHNGRIEALMPPWGNQMSDLQIWNSVAYAWSLHTSAQEITRGETLYAASCAACHGSSGSGDGPDATTLVPDFTDQTWAIAQSQADMRGGWLAAHADVGAEMQPDDQRAVLEYIRGFSMASPWVQTEISGTGSIRGTVVQGTADGGDVAGLTATLDAWLAHERVATLTTTVDANGAFAFSNLSTDPSLQYITSVANQGVSYASDLLALSPITPTIEGEITVYETTDDPGVLRVDRMNWIVETLPNTLTVGQIYAVGNTSDRTYVGARSTPEELAPTFSMAIPAGATDLAFENGILGGRFVQQGDVVFDTLPVAPGTGTRQIILRYNIPYTGTSAIFAQPLVYEIGALNLFVGVQTGLLVDAAPLVSQGVQEISEGANYHLFSGSDLQPQTIDLKLEGLPLESDVASGTETNVTGELPASSPLLPGWTVGVVAGAVALALLAALAWSLVRGESGDEESRAGERASLIDQIALLDDLHAQGALAEDKWQTERSRLKQAILALDAATPRQPDHS